MKKEQPYLSSINLHLDPHLPSSFQCQRCGNCCHGPSRRFGIKLFYQEVKAIQRYLGELFERDEFDEFAWDCCTYFGSPEDIGSPDFLQVFKDSLEDFFFSVSRRASDKKELYVEYYVLKTYLNSGRCIFYNPLELSCLIHAVKPLVCRLYPFYAEIDVEKRNIRVSAYPEEECPGHGCGGSVNIFELGERALAFAGSMRLHYSVLAGLLAPHDTNTAAALDEFYVEKLKYKLASQEQMNQEFSKIRFECRGMEARDLFMETGLIHACEEYRKRLKSG